MSAEPLSVALVLGSRELQATDAAERWALAELAGWVAAFDRLPDLVMTTDGPGAAALARAFARGGGIPWEVWRLRGEVADGVALRRWHDGKMPDDPRWPVRRAERMVQAAAAMRDAGVAVRALVLTALWDPRPGGHRRAAEFAREARLDTTELECPAAYGPPAADVGGHDHNRNA